ncbi:MAG: 30S ribosomal protein S17 [Candidatus Pacearchaeota archaeon]|nr:30S ribosomal protein S17 [Candidatus Pacearchaeota archaeon]
MEEKEVNEKCDDAKCPFHGNLSIRGKYFKGVVIKTIGKRAVIEFERLIYYKKYERYAKKKTKLHAYLPQCLAKKIRVGDLVRIGEVKPLTKIIHFVVIEKIK